MTATAARRWCPDELQLGEGPRWVDGRVVCVDILGGRLLAVPDEPGPLRTLASTGDRPLGAVAPVRGVPGRWIAAVGTGASLLDEHAGLRELARLESDSVRMNDAACDPTGRFWATSMAWERTPGAGSLHRVDHDGSARRVLRGLTVPNGPVFSRDARTMYVADSGRQRVDVYPVDLDIGEIGPARTFLVAGHGSPDGMTVDVDDHVWIALNGAGEVHRYTPGGRLVDVVTVPVEQVSAPCLGGPDGRRLHLTTSWEGMAADDHPDGAGSIYVADVEVPGAPAEAFGAT